MADIQEEQGVVGQCVRSPTHRFLYHVPYRHSVLHRDIMSKPVQDMGVDIASKMLSALITDEASDGFRSVVSVEDQKKYLKKHIDSVSVVDRKGIGRILVKGGNLKAIKACSEGVVINLDILSPAETEQMYNFLVFRKERCAVR